MKIIKPSDITQTLKNKLKEVKINGLLALLSILKFIIYLFSLESKKLTKQQALDLGFKELPHETIGDIITYDLGFNRLLSLADIGGGNEFLFLIQIDKDDPKRITDLIRLHNFDYDGHLTTEKLIQYIEVLKFKPKNNSFK